MASANQSDFLGEGTLPSPAAPKKTPEQIERERQLAEQAALLAAQRQQAQTRSANIASGRLAGAKPTHYGLSLDPATAEEAAAEQAKEHQIASERSGGVWGDLGRIGGYVGGALANPVGFVMDPYVSEGTKAFINPVGYGTAAGLDEALDRYMPGGSGAYGDNLIPGVAGTGGDVRTPSETINAPGLGNFGGVLGDPAAGLGQYAQRTQALGTGARDALRPVTTARDAQARDMFAQGQAAQGRAAPQTNAVDYGQAQQIAETPGAAAGSFGSEQRIAAPTLAAAQQAAMGNFGAQQSVNAARVASAAQATAQQAQAQQAANQAGFLSGTAAGARSIADIDFGQSDESRAAMGESLNRIRAYVDQGPGESAAQAQLRMAQESNLGDALSLARSGRGNAAGNMKMALSENAATNAQTNMQAAQLRAQEADAWRSRQLQGLGLEQQGTTSMRGQDITAATAQGQHALSREQIASNVDVSRAGLEQQLAMNNAELGTRANLTNAQLGTQTSIANAEQTNLGSRLQAQLSTDAAIQQASLANARNIAVGNAGTQVSLGNAEQANLTSRLQGQLSSDAAIQQAALANSRNIASGQAGTQVSIANADTAAARARAQAELANQLAIAQGNSTTNINTSNLDASVRTNAANDALQQSMYGYGLDSQRMGQDALTYGLGLERDYSQQASQLAAEMAKARAIQQAALIGGGASLIEQLIPG